MHSKHTKQGKQRNKNLHKEISECEEEHGVAHDKRE